MARQTNLPVEFRLMAACCMWPPTERRDAAIRESAARLDDWDRFLPIVERQRVAGLVNDGLKRAGITAPEAVTRKLAADADGIARQALLLASEALRLQDLFDTGAVTALFVKGTALGLLAYGSIGLKHAWDIDLLVAPKDIRKACVLLREAGYVRVIPDTSLDDDRFFAWAEFAHECVFRHETRGVFLELHWGLSENPALLARVTAHSQPRLVPVSGTRALRTLCDEDLFAYLCLHGARHGWSRLKWLADLAAWLSSKSSDEVERLYRNAKVIGAGRAPDQTLLLCQQLFALPLAPALAAEMRHDRATRWLVAIALNAMVGADATRQTQDRLFGDLSIKLSHFLLAPGAAHWLHEMRAKSIGWTDFRFVRLPRPLYFLYPMMRIPSWIWRRAAHLLGHS